jgi:2-(1,2-epoxy-1,2-dihydrophenyl)acetyl-CoA isomerase
MSEAVLYSIDDSVASIRFNRPERLNAIDVELAEAFERAVDRAIGDPKARVVVISGEGRAFVAGGDLAYFHKAGEAAAAASRRLIGPMHGAIQRLSESRLISVAALHGAVAGGGMSLALSTDLAVAAHSAVFNMAYVNVAASPDCSGSWHLVRLVGLRRAMQIALLSESIAAPEALALGLVNQVVSPDALHETVAIIAHRLAGGPSGALARTKALLRQAGSASLDEQLDAEAESFAASAGTSDFREALAAFFEKRRPTFE